MQRPYSSRNVRIYITLFLVLFGICIFSSSLFLYSRITSTQPILQNHLDDIKPLNTPPVAQVDQRRKTKPINTKPLLQKIAKRPHFTTQQHEKAQKIFDDYNSIFDDLTVKRGWRRLRFTSQDIEPVLRIASYLSMLIREYLDKQSSGIKLRMIGGQAREYLFGIEKNPSPYRNKGQKYVRKVILGIVKATLSDARGFVEGVSLELIQQFMNSYYDGLYNMFVKS